MNDTKLKALKGSIAKWKKIVARKGRDLGASNCPLCKIFYDEDENSIWVDVKCYGCPVWEKTTMHGCEGTPYMDDWRELDGWDRLPSSLNPKHIAAAKKELQFLQSLLPSAED